MRQSETETPSTPLNSVVHFDRLAVALNILRAPLEAVLAVKIMFLGLLIARFSPSEAQFLGPVLSFGIRMGYASLVNFGYYTLAFVQRPALTMTEDGIEDRSGPASGGYIPWANIVSAQPTGVYFHRGVALYIDDPDDVLLRASGYRRFLQQCNYSLFGTPIHIPTDAITITANDLMDIVYEKIRESRRQPKPDGPLRAGTPYTPREEYLIPYVENPAVSRSEK